MRDKILLDALEEYIRLAVIDEFNNWREQHGRETIPASAIISLSKVIATKALSDYASTTKEGLRWVKASEPPGITKYYVIKWHYGAASVYCDNKNSLRDWAVKNKINLEQIEWLDESPAPESGGEEKQIRQLIKTVFMEAQKGGGYTQETEDYFFKYYDPSVQSSDVKPVASHSCTSSNSIERPKVVCLCGSTGFMDSFQAANLKLTCDGIIVLSVGCNTKSDRDLLFSGELTEELKTKLDDLHKRKIDLADEVFVLNVGGYIGESTRSEIDYAIAHNKPVKYLEPNSEQEDKRSVATKSNQGDDAGNIIGSFIYDHEKQTETYKPSLSKEEGKDEEIKKLENIIDSASTAIDNQTKEIERLNALIYKLFFKDMGRGRTWQQFAKENRLRLKGV